VLLLLVAPVALPGAPGFAQDRPATLPPVTISAKANRDPVEKSYRRMVRGMDLYGQRHALAPEAPLRFRLLPRHSDTDLRDIRLDVVGSSTEFRVPVASDNTFVLPRDRQALDEDAMVVPNRRRQSMTWRTDIRTPGLPPRTRRLGDLRLECEVGMEAGLFSNHRSVFDRLLGALVDTPQYCHRKAPRYLFFSDEPLFGVTLVAGERRETLPVSQLYAGAADDPAIAEDLPYCDCEVLLDRSYFLPLGDDSWPDDTLVEFESMSAGDAAGTAQASLGGIAPGQGTRADVAAAFPAAKPIRLPRGYEVWVDRDQPGRRAAQDVTPAERLFLVDAGGVVIKTRSRPASFRAR
jgi:hypothetical protein